MPPFLFDAHSFLKTLTPNPGIYQMFNAKGEVLYVGKARNLKKRVASYFHASESNIKTISLVKQIHHIETIITNTENEALLLENTLIKKYKPRYNILFRDDKSYPYIVLSKHKSYPSLDLYRGTRHGDARFFGPYPHVSAVRETLNLLQKLFRIRQCDDNFFRHRTRPCLQYQIKRCTAPCVGFIDPSAYQQDVQHAVLFLQGKNQTVIEDLIKKMECASDNLDYEKAAYYRDQIAKLRQIQQQQAVLTKDGNIDVIVAVKEHDIFCVEILTIRAGRLLGSKAYFPAIWRNNDEAEILSAFLAQYYLAAADAREIPPQIILSSKAKDQTWLREALIERAGHAVALIHRPQQERMRWLQIAKQNARQALLQRISDKTHIYQRFEALKEALRLDSIPRRLECFDVSHTQGEATVVACVVFTEQGAEKNAYRKFNITGVTAGDDYGALKQGLMRHYLHLKSEENNLPDVLIIDGGKGQLKQAETVLEELQIVGVTIIAIAKGPTRKAGLETIYISGNAIPVDWHSDSLALHLIQQIRDEAHRFAITGHRGQRAKKRMTSLLEQIPGIGPKRRRELLNQFGGLQELKKGSVEEIAKLPGFNQMLAERVLAVLRRI